MGKGVGILGTISGKVGSMVYYRLTNSNNGEKQGYREYRATTRNPQTDQQLDQRVKMAVVTNEYRALRNVIRRGMQSFAYGDESRRAWLKLALGSEFVGPYLEKGDKSPLPMPNVPISVGGLPEVVVESVDEDGNADTSLLLSGFSSPTTIGDLSRLLLNSNAWLQEGDQLTFVFCIPVAGSGVTISEQSFYYFVQSIELDVSSVVSIVDVPVIFSSSDQGYMSIADADGRQCACAVIVSREGPAGEHLRSTAKFGFSASLSAFYATLNPAAARRSYKKGITAEADWPVEQEGGVGTTPIDAQLLNGGTASVTNLAVVSGYLKASGYFLKVTDVHNAKYNRYFTSLSSSSSTAPDGATNTNTIVVDPSSTLAINQRFVSWLLDKGMTAQYLYLGEN